MLREKLASDVSMAAGIKQANMFGGFLSPAAFDAGAGVVADTGDAAWKHINYGREASALYEPAQNVKHVLNKAVDKLPFTTTTKQTIGGPLTQPTTFGKFMRAGVRDAFNPIDRVIPIPLFPKNLAKQTWETFGSPLWKAIKGGFRR